MSPKLTNTVAVRVEFQMEHTNIDDGKNLQRLIGPSKTGT
jgi:hypothetical protein